MASLIYLNSRNADNASDQTPSDVFWTIPLPRFNNLMGYNITVSRVEVPNVVYPINRFYNKVYFTEDGITTLTATLTSQSYSGTTIADELETQMNAEGGDTYTVTFDTSTKVISISSTGTFYFLTGANDVYYQLGFNSNSFGSSLSGSFTGQAPVNVSGSQYVDIVSNLSTHNWSSSTTAKVLARVQMNLGFGYIITQSLYEKEQLPCLSPDLDRLHISLRDDAGNLWELPFNAFFSMTLRIDPVYNDSVHMHGPNNPVNHPGHLDQNFEY